MKYNNIKFYKIPFSYLSYNRYIDDETELQNHLDTYKVAVEDFNDSDFTIQNGKIDNLNFTAKIKTTNKDINYISFESEMFVAGNKKTSFWFLEGVENIQSESSKTYIGVLDTFATFGKDFFDELDGKKVNVVKAHFDRYLNVEYTYVWYINFEHPILLNNKFNITNTINGRTIIKGVSDKVDNFEMLIDKPITKTPPLRDGEIDLTAGFDYEHMEIDNNISVDGKDGYFYVVAKSDLNFPTVMLEGLKKAVDEKDNPNNITPAWWEYWDRIKRQDYRLTQQAVKTTNFDGIFIPVVKDGSIKYGEYNSRYVLNTPWLIGQLDGGSLYRSVISPVLFVDNASYANKKIITDTGNNDWVLPQNFLLPNDLLGVYDNDTSNAIPIVDSSSIALEVVKRYGIAYHNQDKAHQQTQLQLPFIKYESSSIGNTWYVFDDIPYITMNPYVAVNKGLENFFLLSTKISNFKMVNKLDMYNDIEIDLVKLLKVHFTNNALSIPIDLSNARFDFYITAKMSEKDLSIEYDFANFPLNTVIDNSGVIIKSQTSIDAQKGLLSNSASEFFNRNQSSINAQIEGLNLNKKLVETQTKWSNIQGMSAISTSAVQGGALAKLSHQNSLLGLIGGSIFGAIKSGINIAANNDILKAKLDIYDNDINKVYATIADASATPDKTYISSNNFAGYTNNTYFEEMFNFLINKPNNVIMNSLHNLYEKYGAECDRIELFNVDLWKNRTKTNFIQTKNIKDYFDISNTKIPIDIVNEIFNTLDTGIRINHIDYVNIDEDLERTIYSFSPNNKKVKE